MVTWNGIKIADKGFLINLKRREDRLKNSLIEFEKLKINGVEIFEAIDYLDRPDLDYLCCSASHIEILKKQIENDWEKVIIFEDDFIFDKWDEKEEFYLELINDVINTINSELYDLLYLGTVLMGDIELKNKNIIIPSKTIQTTSYLISKEFSKFVVENYDFRDNLSIMCNESIDTFYSIMSSKKINWKNPDWFNNSDRFLKNNFILYSVNPMIFNQKMSYSDIQKKTSNHFFSNRIRNNQYIPKN